jgi:cation diffusion facilitator CzcD-associated flavoprotein CzcO
MAPRIAIIGSGFSGLCLGIELKRAGIDSFTIYEKADRLGGTWRENTYPGAACDVPSFLYCFSFEQKVDWTRKWSPQSEILAYMEHCAQKYGLLPHLRCNTAIESARFDAAAGVWRLRSAAGESFEAEVLVSGVGQLNRPHTPALPGLERFRGARFHSARWNHAVELAGRRVAVIGNAASAIQFIPEIAPRVAHLTIFQRSANWMLPRGDRAYSEREHRRLARWPWLARLYRWWIYLLLESRFPMILANRWVAGSAQRAAEQNLAEHIADPGLRAALTPDYPIGGKRVLVADDYYPTLTRDNVALVTEPIAELTADAVVTRDGIAHPADVLILATGFETTRFLTPMRIEGLDGVTLEQAWARGARAYRGLTVAGFPNLFLLYGPNTNLGHNSIIFMIECQTRYVLGALRTLMARRLAWLDLEPAALDADDARTQAALARTVWAAPRRSWYKTESGRITNNWWGSTLRYWWYTRRFDVERYRAVASRAAVGPPATGPDEAPARVAAGG